MTIDLITVCPQLGASPLAEAFPEQEGALLQAPQAEVTLYPWKDTPELKAQAVDHVRGFLKAHEPARAGR